jgi:chemotaxis protein CheC
MGESRSFDSGSIEKIQKIFETGAQKARESLRLMMNRNLEINVLGARIMPFEEVSRFRFPEDVPVAMIVLRLLGEGEGFFAFVMFEESAKKVNQILWEEVPEASEVLNISNISALKEMGNIVGSCFLNELSNSSGVELRPSEPVFVYDLMAAIIDTLLIEQSFTSDNAILLDTEIRSPEEGIALDIMFLPSGQLLEVLQGGLENA